LCRTRQRSRAPARPSRSCAGAMTSGCQKSAGSGCDHAHPAARCRRPPHLMICTGSAGGGRIVLHRDADALPCACAPAARRPSPRPPRAEGDARDSEGGGVDAPARPWRGCAGGYLPGWPGWAVITRIAQPAPRPPVPAVAARWSVAATAGVRMGCAAGGRRRIHGLRGAGRTACHFPECAVTSASGHFTAAMGLHARGAGAPGIPSGWPTIRELSGRLHFLSVGRYAVKVRPLLVDNIRFRLVNKPGCQHEKIGACVP
jgi:hypothetical protein